MVDVRKVYTGGDRPVSDDGEAKHLQASMGQEGAGAINRWEERLKVVKERSTVNTLKR